jgi:hypothetical protein
MAFEIKDKQGKTVATDLLSVDAQKPVAASRYRRARPVTATPTAEPCTRPGRCYPGSRRRVTPMLLADTSVDPLAQ